MKIRFVFIILVGLVLCSCNQNELEYQGQIQELESKIETLQKELENEKEKIKIASSFLLISPLQRFFLEVENPPGFLDVSRACLNACAKKLADSIEACSSQTDDLLKCKCIDDSIERASACVRNCPGISVSN